LNLIKIKGYRPIYILYLETEIHSKNRIPKMKNVILNWDQKKKEK